MFDIGDRGTVGKGRLVIEEIERESETERERKVQRGKSTPPQTYIHPRTYPHSPTHPQQRAQYADPPFQAQIASLSPTVPFLPSPPYK